MYRSPPSPADDTLLRDLKRASYSLYLPRHRRTASRANIFAWNEEPRHCHFLIQLFNTVYFQAAMLLHNAPHHAANISHRHARRSDIALLANADATAVPTPTTTLSAATATPLKRFAYGAARLGGRGRQTDSKRTAFRATRLARMKRVALRPNLPDHLRNCPFPASYLPASPVR